MFDVQTYIFYYFIDPLFSSFGTCSDIVATMALFIQDDRSAVGAAGEGGSIRDGSRTCVSYTTCVTENTYLSSCPLEDWEIMVYVVSYGLVVVCIGGPLVAWIVLTVRRMMVEKKKEEGVSKGTSVGAGQSTCTTSSTTSNEEPPSIPLEIDS